jgi:Putative adhesin
MPRPRSDAHPMIKFAGKIVLSMLAVSLAAVLALPGLAQPPHSGPTPPKPKGDWVSPKSPPAFPINFGGDTSERSIAVDSGVKLSLCMTQGNLKINGWGRSEVRVFIRDGSDIGIKTLQTNPRTAGPVWVQVYRADKTKPKDASANECVWGAEVEIDIPFGASVEVKGQETETSVDGVKRVNVRNVGGDISLRNIASGITATTYRGDVSVEDSNGTISVESTNGNILVFDAAPSEVGDTLRARTNSGAISLQRVEHRQTDANSISGSVAFTGELLSGGSYTFGTSNGSIRLSLPPTTSCKVIAIYGFGTFNSELPFKIETENIEPGPVKRVVGRIGSGDATLRVTTNSGTISIKHQ